MQKTETKWCAVYTRKSTDEGLDSAFNSLDAQYDACSAYVKSQVGMGWRLVEKKYDDGGYSGGTMNRPALTELLKDIEAGQINVVVVYKIDRLSRSLCDFTDLSKLFERHGVSFVSVTQQIDTSNATGRMMVNLLVSFAQFEREMTADRIRDKIYASRKRGMWTGGPTPYGYRLVNKQLKVDPDAAEAVRMIFRRYVATGSSLQVARELNESTYKRADGQLWHPRMVLAVLKCRVYTGKLTVKRTGEVFDGIHEAIIDEVLFQTVQKALAANVKKDGKSKRHAILAPLKGILRCGSCGGAMTPVYSNYSKGGGRRRYVYYRCTRDAKMADGVCPIKNISADTVERFVYEQLGKVLRRDDVVGLVTGGDAVKRTDFMEATKDMDDFWARMNPGERERLLRLLVRDVRIWPDKVVIVLALDGDNSRIEIPCCLQTNLGRQHFVVDEPEPTPDTPALAVPKAMRQARRWLELLASGTYRDKKQLADALGFNGSYFGKMLRFPFLSPVIVENIRNGELPEVSVTKLMTLTSPLWAEQQKELGIE